MRRTILPLLALPAASLAEPAPEWEPLAFPGDEGLSFAIDRASIAREQSKVTLRTRMQRREPSPSGLYRVTGRWRYDCSARTAELLEYDVFDVRGESLETMIFPQGSEVEPVQPETAHDFILRAIC